jgi:hypothetical protein
MPSTYSTHLLLELMADGENEGLWGDITNTNLEILGRAISGSTNVTLSGTGHTLTVSQAALSEGHYSVLVLGGAPTGTNTITISPNTVPRIYLVKNDSGQDAVFTQGSGGNATVVNGDIGILFSDGGGASASVTDLTPGLMRNSENLSGLADAATALQNLGVTATAAELNALDGATLDISAVTATAAEVNTLDGFTGDTDDLNYAKDLRATGVTTTEFDRLDGLTASTSELNTLDGVTATTAELNKLDGVTVSTAELNKLDGVTVSTAEINHLDGVTSGIQGQLDGKITSVTAGDDLSGGGSSGSVTISHANTSNQGSVNNGGNTVIQDIFLDSNGHVTNINSKTISAESPVKAWVNFDGTGTASIRESFNVSSITEGFIGDYTVNFATALVDANYAAVAMGGNNLGNSQDQDAAVHSGQTIRSAGSIQVFNTSNGAGKESDSISVVVFR